MPNGNFEPYAYYYWVQRALLKDPWGDGDNIKEDTGIRWKALSQWTIRTADRENTLSFPDWATARKLIVETDMVVPAYGNSIPDRVRQLGRDHHSEDISRPGWPRPGVVGAAPGGHPVRVGDDPVRGHDVSQGEIDISTHEAGPSNNPNWYYDERKFLNHNHTSILGYDGPAHAGKFQWGPNLATTIVIAQVKAIGPAESQIWGGKDAGSDGPGLVWDEYEQHYRRLFLDNTLIRAFLVKWWKKSNKHLKKWTDGYDADDVPKPKSTATKTKIINEPGGLRDIANELRDSIANSSLGSFDDIIEFKDWYLSSTPGRRTTYEADVQENTLGGMQAKMAIENVMDFFINAWFSGWYRAKSLKTDLISFKLVTDPDAADLEVLWQAMYMFDATEIVLRKHELLVNFREANPQERSSDIVEELAEDLVVDNLHTIGPIAPEDLAGLLRQLEYDLKFAPQCFLLHNVKQLADYNKKRIVNPSPSTGISEYDRVFIARGPPDLLMGKLKAKKHEHLMLKFSPAQLSALVPTVRIYKVQYGRETRKFKGEVEFKFPNYTNVESKDRFLDTVLNSDAGSSPLLTKQAFGIKSFEWDFISTQPFTIKNDVTANLTLFFQDFTQFSLKRRAPNGIKYSYSDLIISANSFPSRRSVSSNTQNSSTYPVIDEYFFYDIKVVAGWSVPLGSDDLFTDDQKAAIRATQNVFFLTMVDYDLDFRQTGVVELSINYRARLEATTFNKRANILFDEEVAKELLVLSKSKQNRENLGCGNLSVEEQKKNSEELKKIKEEIAIVRKQHQVRTYQSLLDRLINEECIYFDDFTANDILSYKGHNHASIIAFQSSTPDPIDPLQHSTMEFSNLREALSTPAGGAPYKAFEDKIGMEDDGQDTYRIHYFFLGDLYEIAAEHALRPENFALRGLTESDAQVAKKTSIILSDLTIPDPRDKELFNLNMADIPIDVNIFSQFMYDQVIAKNRESYSLMNFIKEFTAYVLIERMEDCFGIDRPRIRFKEGYLSLPAVKGGTHTIGPRIGGPDYRTYGGGKFDPMASLALESNTVWGAPGDDLKTRKTKHKGSRNPHRIFDVADLKPDKDKPRKTTKSDSLNDQYFYLICYVEASDPSVLVIKGGEYAQQVKADYKRGIYHLFLGNKEGILKEANFVKTDQKFLREHRFAQNPSDPYTFLSNVFEAQVNLVGNNMFFPGQYVYINPRSIGDIGAPYSPGTMAFYLGLGGYHLITKVTSKIQDGKFETKLTARWETNGSGQFRNPHSVSATTNACATQSPDSTTGYGADS